MRELIPFLSQNKCGSVTKHCTTPLTSRISVCVSGPGFVYVLTCWLHVHYRFVQMRMLSSLCSQVGPWWYCTFSHACIYQGRQRSRGEMTVCVLFER